MGNCWKQCGGAQELFNELAKQYVHVDYQPISPSIFRPTPQYTSVLNNATWFNDPVLLTLQLQLSNNDYLSGTLSYYMRT